MSMKRTSNSDLNHDNWDQEEVVEEAGNFKQADQSELNNRVIKKARRKCVSQNTTSSVFAGFSGFSSDGNGLLAKTTPSFDFLKQDKVVTGADGCNMIDKQASPFVFGQSTASVFGNNSPADTLNKSPFNSPFTKQSSFKKDDVNAPTNTTTKSDVDSKSSTFLTPLLSTNDKWECMTCMVYNEKAKEFCVCCSAAKPGSNVSLPDSKTKSSVGLAPGISLGPATSNFKFGSFVSTNIETTSVSPSLFTFGAGVKSGDKTDFSTRLDFASKEKPLTKNEYLDHLGSLNKQVSEWIKTHVDENPLIDLSPIFDDYKRHFASLSNKYKVEEIKSGSPTKQHEEPKKTDISSSAAFSQGSTAFSLFGKKEDKFSFGKISSATTFSSGGVTTTKPCDILPKADVVQGFSFGTNSKFSFGTTPSTIGGTMMFNNSATVNSSGAEEQQEDGDDEDEFPPKVEITQVVEKDVLYSIKCKLYYKKGSEFVDKGVSMLYLKRFEDVKLQMLIRAETNLGNILLNIMLDRLTFTTTKRANNIQFVCLPNPPIPGTEGPVTMLIKVKNASLADELNDKLIQLMAC